MALTALESTTINRAMQLATQLLALKPALDELNTIYNASGGASSTITQDNLNAVPAYSGLTKQQLDDGLYTLTTTIRGGLSGALDQLNQLSARGAGL